MKALILLLTLVTTQAFAETSCNKNCGKTSFSEPLPSPFLNFSNIIQYAGEAYPETLPDDPRQVRNASSPKWLAAVGRSISEDSATTKEQCSLSIVADSPEKDGIIAVTAGHCVDHWARYGEDGNTYRIRKNKVVFTTNSGKKIGRSIAEVLKSEMNPGDYAIVKLNAPISNSDIKPLLNAPYTFFDLLDDELFHKPYATMAGYSADKGKGKKGKVLTYHEKCRLNGGASGMKKGYCYSYQGASGGAVVVTVALGEWADEPWQETTQTYFVGSIVGGRSGDNNSKTLFTDTTHYTQTLDKILAEH